jgi:phosphoserine aminotransferase
MLPEPVLQSARHELLDWNGRGYSLAGLQALVDFMGDFERRHG